MATRVGHRYRDSDTGQTLDVWFPQAGDRRRGCLAEQAGFITADDIELPLPKYDQPPVSTEEAWLRLHLLSECRAKPNDINLEGLFALLTNVAWTSAGPVLPERVEALRVALAQHYATVQVSSIDKFPRMTDYVVPPGVRIADAERVRLGAHLAPGTTVMHEGFINFNAGTLGPSMVEGRITAGVVVGAHSDIGAGASIMGTLSGGGKNRTRIGERCLLGANAGTGISLGDECIVEAGLYLTAGTKVTMPDGSVVAARALSGEPGWLYRRNSRSGAVEAIRTGADRWGGLNAALHTP